MFEFIRKHLTVVMIIFFPLVIFAFVFVGVDTSFLTQRSPVVARVAGQDITQADWDFAHRQWADRNRNIPVQQLDSPTARYGTLERMVRDQVINAAIRDRHYLVSDAQLARELQNQPEIAALRGADGRLDIEAYRALLAQSGLSPESYEANVRYQLATQQVLGVVQEASLTTPRLARNAAGSVFQRRDVQLAHLQPADYADKVEVTPAALQDYYQAHLALFQQPEQVDVEYVVLDLDSIMPSIQISEDELRQYYESNKGGYARAPEQRRASHILINSDASMSESEREAARAKAESLLAQVRENPARFAELARAESEDPGTRDNGGDLGFMGRGEMVSAFDDAVFNMSKGAISNLVATEYGFHIIELTDIKPADIPSFEEVHERLEQDVKRNLANTQFIEAADQLRNLAHEQPDSLEPLAGALGLQIQSAKAVERDNAASAPEALRNPAVLDALFSSRATQEKLNIDAVDTGSSQVVTARVSEFHPARQQSFEEVQPQVEAQFRAQESAKLAQADGEAKLKAWQASPDDAQLAESVTVSRVNPQGLDETSLRQVMATPTDALPQFLGFVQFDGSYLIVKVTAIAPLENPDMPAQEQARLTSAYEQQIAQMQAVAELEAYYEVLKQQYKVQIRVPNPIGG
ncbi:peptidylprolyl isomerase [Corticibacter populi]|nr:SurA N-terminal domain-containing protein [Corticibacter populi]